MVQTLLPRDAHNTSIQTMAPVASQARSFTGTTARTTQDFETGVKVVELRPTMACFIKFGDGTVEATSSDFFLLASERVTYHIGTHTRVAVIPDTTGGTLHITELA